MFAFLIMIDRLRELKQQVGHVGYIMSVMDSKWLVLVVTLTQQSFVDC